MTTKGASEGEGSAAGPPRVGPVGCAACGTVYPVPAAEQLPVFLSWERSAEGALCERRRCVCGAPVAIPRPELGEGVALVRTAGRLKPVRFVRATEEAYVTDTGAKFRRGIGHCSYRVGARGPLTPVLDEAETARLEAWAKGREAT